MLNNVVMQCEIHHSVSINAINIAFAHSVASGNVASQAGKINSYLSIEIILRLSSHGCARAVNKVNKTSKFTHLHLRRRKVYNTNVISITILLLARAASHAANHLRKTSAD